MDLAKLTARDVEDFLYHEAELLDNWRMLEWRELLTEECTYSVPSIDAPEDATAETTLFYIADDGFRLTERVKRLMKKTCHAEYPRSKVLHTISNVRLLEANSEFARASAYFVTYRHQRGNQDIYVGRHVYRFVAVEGQLKIKEKTSYLHLEALRPHGRITLIV
jgi:p-cumate 2,3-dioxygenase beta subunit